MKVASVSDVYYEDFDMYFKDETQQIWYKDKYGIKNMKTGWN